MNNILIKTSGKRVLYFYGKKGICLKNLLRTNSVPKMIYEDAVGDFDVIEMNNGEVGIICQDKDGGIVFLKEHGNVFLKTTLLKSKEQKIYDKSFTLHKHGEWITTLYVVEYDNKLILSHQIVDNENETPFAVDEITTKKYYSFKDNCNNLFVFYNKKDEFGYRMFKWSEKAWSDYNKVGEGFLKACTDSKNGDYYLLCESDNKENLIYLKNDNLILKEEGIEKEDDTSEDAVMFFEGENLWIIRENKDKLFGVKMSECFEKLSGPLFFGNDVYKRKYRIKTSEANYYIHECFGYETNNIPKLIVYKDLYNTSVVDIPERITENGKEICDFAGIQQKTASKDEIEINKLKLKVTDLQKRISRIENIINNQ